MLYCSTPLYHAILYYTTLHYTIPYYILLYSTLLYFTSIVYYIVLYYVMIYYILYYTIEYYTILYLYYLCYIYSTVIKRMKLSSNANSRTLKCVTVLHFYTFCLKTGTVQTQPAIGGTLWGLKVKRQLRKGSGEHI